MFNDIWIFIANYQFTIYEIIHLNTSGPAFVVSWFIAVIQYADVPLSTYVTKQYVYAQKHQI